MAKHMDVLNFLLASPLQFNWTGKFIAPDENWTHITRALTDYEFIVMTDGELYIADDKRQYVVKSGEYLIMPPTLKQYGISRLNVPFTGRILLILMNLYPPVVQ